MKVHEFINNIPDFSSPISITIFEDNQEITVSEGLSRKMLLTLFGEHNIFSIGATQGGFIKINLGSL